MPTEQPSPPASPSPLAFPLPESPSGGTGTFEWPAPLGGTILAAAAGLGGAGGLALIVRELRRWNGRPASATGRHRHSTGDAGRVDLAARSLLQALRELGFEDVRLLLVRESERLLDFTLDCAPGDADALVRSRFDIGRRLACAADAEGVSSTRVQLKLSRFQRLAGMLLDRAISPPVVLLVPVGAAQNGIHYLNLTAAGSVLLTGSPTETSQMTSSWVSSLGILHQQEQLAFLTAGWGQQNNGAPSPNLATVARDGGGRSIQQLAAELEEAIVSREATADTGARPSMVSFAVLGEQGAEDLTRLDTVVHRGPEHGIFMVCVAHQPVDVPNMFGARVAFGGDKDAPEGLTLTIWMDAPVALMPVDVRAQPLRRNTEPQEWVDAEVAGSNSANGAIAVLEEADVEQADAPSDDPIDQLLAPPVDVTGGVNVESPVSDPRPFDNGGGQRSRQAALLVADVATPIDEAVVPSPDVVREAGVQSPVSDPRPAGTGSGQGSRQATLLVEEEAPAVETATAAPPTFEIRCFGSFQVFAGDQQINGWTIQKARELLAYLIARGGTQVSRDETADALWPDESPGQVEHLLSNAAYYLRRTLKGAVSNPDEGLLAVSGQRYHLRSGVFRVDLDAFDAHLRRAETLQGADALIEYSRALAIYRGDFLGNEPYEWADAYRRDYQRRFVAAAHQAGHLALECRDVKKAMGFYRVILDRDPIDEEAARALMACHAKVSDTNAVRKVYKVLRESLRRELEDEKAEPLPETTALVQALTR